METTLKERITLKETKENLLKILCDSVVNMDEDLAAKTAEIYINSGLDPYDAISLGLAAGMDKVGKLYEEEEYYIPELLMCSDAMYSGMNKILPHLKASNENNKLKAVLGVVKGDTHDIGKNLFKIMLETYGFQVYDLGKDVAPDEFINKVKEVNANLVAMSTLMTTTMCNMEVVIKELISHNLRDSVVVMVGGGPISKSFAERIGADGFDFEASKAAKLAKELVTTKFFKF